jgi:hypothetical protein
MLMSRCASAHLMRSPGVSIAVGLERFDRTVFLVNFPLADIGRYPPLGVPEAVVRN